MGFSRQEYWSRAPLPSPTSYLFIHGSVYMWTSLVAQMVKRLRTVQETQVQSLYRDDLLERGMATYSSVLTWKIPWTEEHGSIGSMGSQRVGHD